MNNTRKEEIKNETPREDANQRGRIQSNLNA